MIIGVVSETEPGECRVAATPASVKKLIKLGYDVHVQSRAGFKASFPDSAYEQSGAKVMPVDEVYSSADILIKVNAPSDAEMKQVRDGTTLISFVRPAQNEAVVEKLNTKKMSTLAMDCVPRISRAQKLDALSSMANIAGYRAVIEAANEFGSFFTGQITAAGKVPPAKVLVIGAGVAGLSAIGTAKSLGAIVRAFDTRMAVQDQVKSMGADFLVLDFEESGEGEGGYAKTMSKEFIDAEMKLFAEQAKEVDIIVTTALIPGKPAPVLITEEMVKMMKPGSVIVDLAAENGGNCELTRPGEKTVEHDVTIIGFTDFPSRLPTQSSNLYGNNIVNLLSDMTKQKDGNLVYDLDDVVVRGSLVTHDGNVMWPPPKIENPSPPKQAQRPSADAAAALAEARKPTIFENPMFMLGSAIAAGLLLLFVGHYADREFLSHLTVFVLACFAGWQLVWSVTPALHTPLMSVTNAVSGIIVIGGMLQLSGQWFPSLLALLAVLVATINVSGGFLVTHRMLDMFRKD